MSISQEEYLRENYRENTTSGLDTTYQPTNQPTNLLVNYFYRKQMLFHVIVTGEKFLITNAAARNRTQATCVSSLHYNFAIKASLYHKKYKFTIIRFSPESKFEQLFSTGPPSPSGHQAYETGLSILSAICNRLKNSNHQCPDRRSNTGDLRDKLTNYPISLKAGLYIKAGQVYITKTCLYNFDPP